MAGEGWRKGRVDFGEGKTREVAGLIGPSQPSSERGSEHLTF